MSGIAQPDDPADGLMTVAEVAKFLHFSRDKVYRMVKKSEISCVRAGTRALRFKKRHVEEWLEKYNPDLPKPDPTI
jgi:excisionase family DNA binding protein